MDLLFTNTNKRKDFFRFELEKRAVGEDIFIAVPFFTDYNLIEKFLNNNCEIRLIIRLCHVTNSSALRKLMDKNNILIRYYTSRHFHSKLYIFGNTIAYVGSSNFTDSGMISNQEINVGILPEDNRFDELLELFNSYWNQAEVLTKDIVEKFSNIQSQYKKNIEKYKEQFENQIKNNINEVDFANLDRINNKKRSKENVFISNFLKRYQTFLQKHKILEDIYKKNTKRKFDDKIPLRLEIDQFLSWIREKKASSKKYLNVTQKKESKLRKTIPILIEKFIKNKSDYNWLYGNYNKLRNNLGNEKKIKNISSQKLFESLTILHSFSARQRFFEGGMSGMKEEFLNDNEEEKIKNTLIYLLYGEGNYAERIAKCIFDSKYKLKHFGESNIKELYGWLNDEEVPICNDRTLKSMQWLGFYKFLNK